MTNTRRALIFVNIIITCVATAFLSTALTSALPPIISEFGISAVTGQWLSSGFSLTTAVITPLSAYLITRFPTKKIHAGAIVFVAAGLAICIFSSNFYFMMAGRILQAMGQGVLTALSQVVLLTIYPKEKKGQVMGWYGLSIAAAPVIAPVLSGVIVDTIGWRYIFVITEILIIISLVFAVVVFTDVLETKKTSFDFISLILSGLTFGCITFGFGNITGSSLNIIAVTAIIACGFISGILFTLRQLRLSSPLLDVRSFKNRDYTVAVVISMCLYSVMMGTSMILPLFVQSVLNKSALTSGLVILPGALAMIALNPVAGRLYDKKGIKFQSLLSACLLVISNVAMLFVTMDMSPAVTAIINMFRCMGVGLLMMPIVAWGMKDFKGTSTAHGTALLTSLRNIAGALGMVVYVGLFSTGGIHLVFTGMTIISLILLGCVVIFISGNRKNSR